MHLDTERGELDANLGAAALDHRNQQIAAGLRGASNSLIAVTRAEIELIRRIKRQRTHRFDLRFHGE